MSVSKEGTIVYSLNWTCYNQLNEVMKKVRKKFQYKIEKIRFIIKTEFIRIMSNSTDEIK